MAKNDYTDLQEQLRMQSLQQAAANNTQEAPTYAGTYEDQLAQIYGKIANREPFSYDVNADPLYQNYKDQYIQGGKLAMKDTMGKAAALTGGYGSTYGQQVGQQAYDAYLQDLSAVIPELYGMAYDMYRDKGNDLTKQYGLLGDMRDTEYNRYRDALGDYKYQQERARQLEDTEYNRRIAEQNSAFTRQQQAYSNLVALMQATGYNPTDDELAAAGLSREAADAILAIYLQSITPARSGGGGGGTIGRTRGDYEGDDNTNGTGGLNFMESTGLALRDLAAQMGGNGGYTTEEILRAYDNARSTGNTQDANRLLNAAADAGIIQQDDKKTIFKHWQVK